MINLQTEKHPIMYTTIRLVYHHNIIVILILRLKIDSTASQNRLDGLTKEDGKYVEERRQQIPDT